MARPEITSRKVEETTTVESKKKGKGKTTRKRHPLPPRREGDAYTISELEPWKRSVPRSRLSASTLANDFTPDYWNTLWGWYHTGGFEHVAAYLAELDISGFDPKAPPLKTPAFWDIVNANVAPEDAELADVIDKLGNPNVLTIKQLIAAATGATAEWLMGKNRRALPHRLERCGYIAVRNPNTKDGMWRLNGERQMIYGKANLSPAEAIKAARKLGEKQEG